MILNKSNGDDSITLIKGVNEITIFIKSNRSAILEQVETIPERWLNDKEIISFIAA